MSNISRDYDMQLAASVQRDYLQRAANYRLAEDAGIRDNIVSTTCDYVLGRILQKRRTLSGAAATNTRFEEDGGIVTA